MKLNAMITLLVKFGYLEDDSDVATIRVVDVPPVQKLQFYWVVPFGKKEEWIRKAPKRYAKRKKWKTTRQQMPRGSVKRKTPKKKW